MKYLISLVCAVAMVGCSSQPEPNAKVETDRVESAKKMRQAFDRTGGNFEQLTSVEKDEFLKLFNGNESDARRAWDFMKNPPGGATQGSKPAGL